MLEKIVTGILVFMGLGFALWGLSRGGEKVTGCGGSCSCSETGASNGEALCDETVREDLPEDSASS